VGLRGTGLTAVRASSNSAPQPIKALAPF